MLEVEAELFEPRRAPAEVAGDFPEDAEKI